MSNIHNMSNGILRREFNKNKEMPFTTLRSHLEYCLCTKYHLSEKTAEEIVRRFLKENK